MIYEDYQLIFHPSGGCQQDKEAFSIQVKMFNHITLILLNPVNVSRFFISRKDFKIFLVLLNLIYVIFSTFFLLCVFSEFVDVKFSIGTVLIFTQIVIPQILQIYIVLESIRDKNIELMVKIHRKLRVDGVVRLQIKFIVQILIVIVIHLAKLLYSTKFFNFAYCLCVLIPDAIRSANDFLFAYHVDILTQHIKNSMDDVNFFLLTPSMLMEIRNKITNYSKLSFMLSEFYSNRLLLTITLNIVLLINSFYWIFIRLAFDHFESLETFLYLVQPLLCILTVFYSSHNCFVMVSQLKKFMCDFLE